MPKWLEIQLYEVDVHLDELREMLVQKCRKTSTEEKRKLGAALTRLSPEDLGKALEIVAQSNTGFQATAEEVELDMDAQSESTLWRLKFFVKDALKSQGNNNNNDNNKNNNNSATNNNKRKREICDAIAKTAKKKKQKPSA